MRIPKRSGMKPKKETISMDSMNRRLAAVLAAKGEKTMTPRNQANADFRQYRSRKS